LAEDHKAPFQLVAPGLDLISILFVRLILSFKASTSFHGIINFKTFISLPSLTDIVYVIPAANPLKREDH
jgi:hypothetical protein